MTRFQRLDLKPREGGQERRLRDVKYGVFDKAQEKEEILKKIGTFFRVCDTLRSNDVYIYISILIHTLLFMDLRVLELLGFRREKALGLVWPVY